MEKVLKYLVSLSLIVICAVMVASCDNKKTEGELSRVQIDVNPSIELMVDEDGKVISVSALNDDGSIIIAGEAIVNKTVEEATEIIVQVCTETGYIVKGEVTASDNNVKISVSGDSDYAKELAAKVKDTAKEYLEKSGVKANVEQVNAMAVTELRKLVLNNSTYTEEEVNAMDEKALLQALAVGRIETAELATEEMKKIYFEAKAYEIAFTEKEAFTNVIKNAGVLYSAAATMYSQALEMYRTSITSLEELKYNTLISPESAYQKALVELREAKAKYVEQRSYVASLEVGDLKVTAEIELENLYKVYEKAEENFVKLGDDAAKTFDTVIANLKQAESYFAKGEELLKSFDIESLLTAKAEEMETAINTVKNNFFDTFEKAHKDDIAKIENDLKAHKESLKESIANGMNKE